MARAAPPVILHSTKGLPAEIVSAFGPAIEGWNEEIIDRHKSAEQRFAELDVQPGDRVRLTEANTRSNWNRDPLPDGATLEGEVVRVKRGRTDGKWKIQIKGFAVSSGNNVFWPVENYKVEVLHRAYGWTPEDRVIAELAGFTDSGWVQASETNKRVIRGRYGPRARKIIAALGG